MGFWRNLITQTLSEIHFENRKEALRQKPSSEKTILPFVTQYQPSVPSLKNILMKHWQLIEKQPLLRQIYKEPPIISYKRGRSLKDILVKAKLWDLKAKTRGWKAWVRLVNPYDISKWLNRMLHLKRVTYLFLVVIYLFIYLFDGYGYHHLAELTPGEAGARRKITDKATSRCGGIKSHWV